MVKGRGMRAGLEAAGRFSEALRGAWGGAICGALLLLSVPLFSLSGESDMDELELPVCNRVAG